MGCGVGGDVHPIVYTADAVERAWEGIAGGPEMRWDGMRKERERER